jgi:Papain-like cysteine protease AvrRpt2
MAIEFDIQVRNGAVKITVGGAQTNTGNASDQGGSSPANPSTNTGGGGPGGGSGSECGGPVIIGPIVVHGLSLQSGTQGQSGQGGSSPANPSNNTGGGGPRGGLGGSSPANPSNNTGGGGPGSGGSRPGCPVIIGPIVIGGCSGQASDPPALSNAQEIAVSPPVGVNAKGLAGTFNMQSQDETDWCWAAVAVSINAYLDPPADPLGGPTWTQQSLATQVLAQELQWNPAVDCSADPNEECDRPAGLNDALSITGNLMQGGYRSNCFLDFASLQKWMDQQLPVGARILWPGGGAHFIALAGYQVFASGEQKVVVQDPLYGPSVQDYSSLRGQYVYHGSWNDTYLVTP